MKTVLLLPILAAAALAQPAAPFTDTRDGRSYRTVKIGEQVWMAENLQFEVAGSYCYSNKYNKPANCEKYGRFYNLETAMNVCPIGWHLPSQEEWGILIDFAGGRKIAGKKLKAKTGWHDNISHSEDGKRYVKPGNGTDDFGFAAIPGGYAVYPEEFMTAGYNGKWWANSKADSILQMNFAVETANIGSSAIYHNVRCVRD